ncbi:hypothetical protein HGG74_04950 [Arthrobacter sp. E918]|uniref:Neutral zinc metallopeptidase n=1 Tax=Arthrobacter mobilis TaxID=2724944 RepID=A0A7X6HDZ2_9MICC|nr:hypothetical protein [Arthrobacter mobilis]
MPSAGRPLASLALAATFSLAGAGGAAAVTVPEPAPVENLEQDIKTAQTATDAYWATHWNEFFTGTYTSPTVVGLYDGTNPATAPVCGGQPLGPGNAYYCPEGDYVAWDIGLMETGYLNGDAWPYLVVAHEWGHAVQYRLAEELRSQAAELQADCFAGASLFGAAADGTLVFEDGDQQELEAALTALADQTPWTKAGDHGNAAERVEAFSTGREGGPAACLPEAP